MAIAVGKYIIRSALNEDLVLMVSGGSKSKGARVTTGALTETDNRCYWHAAVVATNFNSFYNVNAGTKTGYIVAAKIQNGNAITQNAWNSKTLFGQWLAELSGNTMEVNGATVNTYFLKHYKKQDLYLTVPDNGGDATLASLIDGTPSTVNITTSGAVTVGQIDRIAFQTAVNNTAGTYVFAYDGTDWSLDSTTISLSTYGITIDDSETPPESGDTISVVFTEYIEADTSRQEFYFEATTYVDKTLATPKTLRTADDKIYVLARGTTSFYPQWKSSKSSTIYEMRYRSRRYDADGNLIDDWSSWTGWNMIQAAAQLDKKKKYNGTMRSKTSIPTLAVDNTTYSKAEVQVQVRLTSASKASAYNKNSIKHGTAVSQIITQYCNPAFTISAALYSPDGLGLAYTSDYTVAGSSILISSITDNGVVLVKNYEFTGQDFTGDLFLNCDELNALPNANDILEIKATFTADNGIAKTTINTSLQVSFDSSWGLTLEPTYALTDRLTVLAGIPVYSTLELYLEHKQLDGTSYWAKCDEVYHDSERVVFEFAPAYGVSPNLMWLAIDENSNWTNQIVTAPDVIINSKFYSWFWIDSAGRSHAVLLKYNIDEVMQPDDNITLGANKFITTGREYPVFRYSKSLERALDIDGIVLKTEMDQYCTLDDIESLAAANHCVYRRPDGKWFQVAITGIKFSKEELYTKVTISQEAETR